MTDSQFGQNWYSQEGVTYDIGGNIVPVMPEVAFPVQGIDIPAPKGAYDPGAAPFTFSEGETPEKVLAEMAVNAGNIYTRIENEEAK